MGVLSLKRIDVCIWTLLVSACPSAFSEAQELRREYSSAPLLGSGGAGITDVSGIDALFLTRRIWHAVKASLGTLFLSARRSKPVTMGLQSTETSKPTRTCSIS